MLKELQNILYTTVLAASLALGGCERKVEEVLPPKQETPQLEVGSYKGKVEEIPAEYWVGKDDDGKLWCGLNIFSNPHKYIVDYGCDNYPEIGKHGSWFIDFETPFGWKYIGILKRAQTWVKPENKIR